jgi:antagonist of KipI
MARAMSSVGAVAEAVAGDDTAIEVLKPGLLTSIQDQGWPGMAHLALSQGGAMDRRAMVLANLLVGNAPDDAGIEITGPGPTLRFLCDAWIATVGARHACLRSPADASDAAQAVPLQRPVRVSAGDTLRWQAPDVGWRSWIAVAGGIAVPPVMGSRSGHLAAGIGSGRLRAGERLPLVSQASDLAPIRAASAATRRWPAWHVADDLPRGWPEIDVPVLPGRHLELLSPRVRRALLEQLWVVSSQSNRQGLRLEGPVLECAGLPQLASEPVNFGTVQLPPAGLPVILMGEHQTTGGYPRVLEAATAAESVLAQAAPGCRIRFRLIDLAEADRLAQQRARAFMQRIAGVSTVCASRTDRKESS